MKNSIKKTNRSPHFWRNIAIVFILVSLLISALPNFYTDKTQLTVYSSTHGHQLATPQSWVSLFSKQSMEVLELQTSGDTTQITLNGTYQPTTIEKWLKRELDEHAAVQGHVESSAPQWLKKLNVSPIKLGLDLSGGVLFVLDVDIEKALSEKFLTIKGELKSLAKANRLRGLKVYHPSDNQLRVSYPFKSHDKANLVFEQLRTTYPEITVTSTGEGAGSIVMSEEKQVEFRREVMAQTLKTMRGRIEELGITEAVTQRQGKDKIRIELPGVHDPDEAKRIIGATATLDFYQMNNGQAGRSITLADETGRRLNLDAKAIFSGSNIKNAQSGQDEMGIPLVSLTLDSLGGDKMNAFSKDNIGKPIVTVYSEYYRNDDNEVVKKRRVVSVATIQQQLGSRFSITNLDSAKEARDLAMVLRAGSLSAPVTIVKQRSIEATLGADNIENGIKALALGLTLTLVFMVLWYRSLGLIANLALAFNLVCLLGLMSLLPGAVLTLPGIAGLVLTVGMAVDTNVLIFERIKEELRRGRKTLMAIEHGYNNAFSTIFDANITTLMTGLILYAIGYGPVKGFATILCLGIITSLFTGVLVSKALTQMSIRKNKPNFLGVSS